MIQKVIWLFICRGKSLLPQLGLHFGSKKTGKKIDSFRGFVDKFSLFQNLSEALGTTHKTIPLFNSPDPSPHTPPPQFDPPDYQFGLFLFHKFSNLTPLPQTIPKTTLLPLYDPRLSLLSPALVDIISSCRTRVIANGML